MEVMNFLPAGNEEIDSDTGEDVSESAANQFCQADIFAHDLARGAE